MEALSLARIEAREARLQAEQEAKMAHKPVVSVPNEDGDAPTGKPRISSIKRSFGKMKPPQPPAKDEPGEQQNAASSASGRSALIRRANSWTSRSRPHSDGAVPATPPTAQAMQDGPAPRRSALIRRAHSWTSRSKAKPAPAIGDGALPAAPPTAQLAAVPPARSSLIRRARSFTSHSRSPDAHAGLAPELPLDSTGADGGGGSGGGGGGDVVQVSADDLQRRRDERLGRARRARSINSTSLIRRAHSWSPRSRAAAKAQVQASTLEGLTAEYEQCRQKEEVAVLDGGAGELRRKLDLLERMSVAIAQANLALDELADEEVQVETPELRH